MRWASAHTDIPMTQHVPDGCGIGTGRDTHKDTLNRLWYSQNEFEEFVRYNNDLVTYALQTGPQRERDWVKLEHALNRHEHSLRGLERNPGMPQATLRNEKHEMAILGLLEACKIYKHDFGQIAMVYGKLTLYSKQIALLAGEDDTIAALRCPNSNRNSHSRRLSNGTKEKVKLAAGAIKEKANKTRRGSLGQEIVKSIKRFPRRLSLKSR